MSSLPKKISQLMVLVIFCFFMLVTTAFSENPAVTLKGDVNEDDVLDLVDVDLILQLLTQKNPSDDLTSLADVNEDGKISLIEAIYALQTLPVAVFTVTYHGNGNDGGSPPVDSKKYEEGAVVAVSENSGSLFKSGFTFDNWKDGNGETLDAGATFDMPAEDINLYAQWTINTYTVTFLDHDGTVLKTEEIDHGSSATA